MSVRYLMILIFLCISLHACCARHLSTIDNKKQDKKPHFSIKNDEKISFEGKKMGTWLVAQKQSMEGRSTNNKRVHKAIMGKDSSSGALKAESHVSSVSWRVPHKKPSEKNPGFNLDYSPPKTHPPHHN